MQRLLHHPFTVLFAGAFGALVTALAYRTLARGWFQYVPEQGATRVFSPQSEPQVYWPVSIGMLSAGISFLAGAAYSAYACVRVLRAGKAAEWSTPPVTMRGLMIAGVLVGIIVCLVSTCVRH